MRNFCKKLKRKKINFLELGVANGHSLASWYKYLKINIYGIDLKKNLNYFIKERLNYFSVDITNNKAVKNF